MPSKYRDFFKEANPFFYRSIPKASVLFALLIVLSLAIGITAVALLNIKTIGTSLSYVIVNGTTTGILIITLPTLLTVIVLKAIKRYVGLKYVFFLTMIGTIVYSLFLLLGSAAYAFGNAYTIASVVILVGDASIFGWWVFAAKFVLGQKKKAILLALIQPTLNILLYIPYSTFIFSFSTPLYILLLKLYAGIFVFLVVTYAILFVFDKPIEKGLGGFHGLEAVSQMMQNWLFDINISTTFGGKLGVPTDISTDTIVLKDRSGKIKAIFFAPDIHYGPSGTIAGSNFPFMLEKHSMLKYKAVTFVMHRPVNLDHNPISITQFGKFMETFDNSVKSAAKASKNTGMLFSRSKYKNSFAIRLWLNNIQLVTLTRAPHVTEDIAPEVAYMFRGILEQSTDAAILIDAHNSRYETAPKDELDCVNPDSPIVGEYEKAIFLSGKPQHKSGSMRVGAYSTELYNRLGRPRDLAEGNLNAAVFSFNGFKYTMLQFNCNNMLPNLRNEIVEHVRRKFKTDVEVYTTDTHAVNSPGMIEGNVLGRHANRKKIIDAVDEVVGKAMLNVAPVSAYYKRDVMKNFMVWGPNVRERLTVVAESVIEIARVLVPVLAAVGFIVAAWVILIV